ncbi:UNVERIFIED_CONTAM: hypothetical protein Sradi_4919000 [Sesamum radiatum]|uniref:Uncharacterized protein n=1 Tax=Sesamum radiatum TaxID=300843 RepID=A0AAW2MEC6_SESRA
MKILNWNCQGLGPPWTIQNFIELVRLHSPGLVFFSETKSMFSRYQKLKERLNYHGLRVDSNSKSGGLLLLWCKDVEVWIQSYSNNHIDFMVKEDT